MSETIKRFEGLEIVGVEVQPVPVIVEAVPVEAIPVGVNPEVFKVREGVQTAHLNEQGEMVTRHGQKSDSDIHSISESHANKLINLPAFAEKVAEKAIGKRDVLIHETALTIGEGFTWNEMSLLPRAVQALSVFLDMKTGILEWLLANGYPDYAVNVANDKLSERLEIVREKRLQKTRGRTVSENFLMRIRPELGSDVVRHIASEHYGVLDNVEVLDLLMSVLPEPEKVKLVHVKVNGDKIGASGLFPDMWKPEEGRDSNWGVGMHFRNSEVGDGCANFSPFVYSSMCENGLIYDEATSSIRLNKKHLGNMDISEQLNEVISITLSRGWNIVEQLELSKQVIIPETLVPAMILHLAERHDLTKDQASAWWNGYQVEGGESANALINGLTRAAHESFSGEVQTDMESLAGRLLTNSLTANLVSMEKHWARPIAGANSVDPKDIEKLVYVRS